MESSTHAVFVGFLNSGTGRASGGTLSTGICGGGVVYRVLDGVALLQHRAGRRFMFEHCMTASSWQCPCAQLLLNVRGVQSIVLDMCRYGMHGKDEHGVAPLRKATRIMTNDMVRTCFLGDIDTCNWFMAALLPPPYILERCAGQCPKGWI